MGAESNGGIRIVCTLRPDQMPDRHADWQALIDQATSRHSEPGGVRFHFRRTIDVAAIAALMTAEQECCRFFTFSLTVGDADVMLEITAPDDAASLLDALISDES